MSETVDLTAWFQVLDPPTAFGPREQDWSLSELGTLASRETTEQWGDGEDPGGGARESAE